MSAPPPIRAKLLRILLLPLVSMAALWGFIAYSSVQEIIDVSRAQDRWEAIGSPVQQLIVELQRERQLSAEAPRSTASYAPLLDQRRNTDVKVERLREIISTLDSDEETPAQVRAMVQALDGLQSLRASADGGVLAPPLTIIEAYNNLISVANRQFNDRDALSDVSSFRSVRGMAAYAASAEYLGREHAVLTTTIVHRRMTPTDRAAFVAAMSARRLVFANAERDAGPELKAGYDALVASPQYRRVAAVEDELFTFDTGGAPPVSAAEWKGDAEALLGMINRGTQAELARVAEEGEGRKTGAYWRVGVVLLLGLAAILLSLGLSYRFGRSLIGELRRLQASAVELAEERLPRLVERLRRGDDVDPAIEAPGLDPADTAEVDRVVDAFSAVRRTAVEAAVGQATLRKGVGQVFLNLARRNQALLHRQLSLLDTMERRVDEPELLEDLFKLDHLTTRMRRHAENLIILSDSVPARRWRDPVPLFDVVRAGVLEVEDYTRVTVSPMPQAPMLVGAAVTDVIHLVAELVENATVFSPPDTSVQVRGMTAANGFALEVEDRGLGLNEATLNELNARLAEPPEFDLADSDRLGLFVVSRLAARHGIKIVLRRSPYDGTTAIVLLPSGLLAGPEGPAKPVPAGRAMRALDTGSGGPQVPEPLAPEPRPPLAPEPRPPLDAEVLNGHRVLDGPEEPEPSGRGTWFEAASPPRAGSGNGNGNGTSNGTGPPAGWSVTVPPQDADEDLDGLPMRVPQASLAPQLRTARRTPANGLAVRSPEELAQLMSSMQQGWQQGRRQADEQGQDVWNRKDDHPDARPQK
ncbi:nitrate- and nitrite sensing domain-containing protein [Nonomuraea sp. NPDC050783]|uniref:sensor histidine kinase n=1 Tax=Nonomuraea sp. NPDC050783 TaxID=3154634 RepID=UPI003466D1D9